MRLHPSTREIRRPPKAFDLTRAETEQGFIFDFNAVVREIENLVLERRGDMKNFDMEVSSYVLLQAIDPTLAARFVEAAKSVVGETMQRNSPEQRQQYGPSYMDLYAEVLKKLANFEILKDVKLSTVEEFESYIGGISNSLSQDVSDAPKVAFLTSVLFPEVKDYISNSAELTKKNMLEYLDYDHFDTTLILPYMAACLSLIDPKFGEEIRKVARPHLVAWKKQLEGHLKDIRDRKRIAPNLSTCLQIAIGLQILLASESFIDESGKITVSVKKQGLTKPAPLPERLGLN